MLYEFIKNDLNDFFVELKKRILDKYKCIEIFNVIKIYIKKNNKFKNEY